MPGRIGLHPVRQNQETVSAPKAAGASADLQVCPVFTAVILVRGAIDPIDDEIRFSFRAVYLQVPGCAEDLFRDSFKSEVPFFDLFLHIKVKRFPIFGLARCCPYKVIH